MNTRQVNRRKFLSSAVAASAVVLGEGFLSSRHFAAGKEPKRYFAPVKVSRDRLIRTVVGLRPFRPQGFLVGTERSGDKLLVHNYGHGGAGITLSWGTSSLAVELARDSAESRFAVLGCGVMGLTTARLLQRRGHSVTIYAKNLPPETTSNVAAALWLPTSAFDHQIVSAKFLEDFRLAAEISNRAFQTLVGAEYGVRWRETYELLRDPGPLERELAGGARLYPETQIHKEAKNYFNFPYVRQFNTMMIDPHVYLNALLRDYYVAGGKIVVKELRSREEVSQLPEAVVFNCTGLGARSLFGDMNLVPVRGQLEVLLPQAEIDYGYLSGSTYMFPRQDGIILGGTFDRNRWSLEPDPEQTTGILEAHAEVMKALKR